jgi:hypothetical protein
LVKAFVKVLTNTRRVAREQAIDLMLRRRYGAPVGGFHSGFGQLPNCGR